MLYLAYFPKHLKYQRTLPLEPATAYGAVAVAPSVASESNAKPKVTTTPEWRLAVTLAIVVALHLCVDFLSSPKLR